MVKQRIKPNYRRRLLRLPDLDHCKRSVLNSLGSPASRRVYEYAIDQFIDWHCSEPRLCDIVDQSGVVASSQQRGIGRMAAALKNRVERLEKEKNFQRWFHFVRFVESFTDKQLEDIAIYWRFPEPLPEPLPMGASRLDGVDRKTLNQWFEI